MEEKGKRETGKEEGDAAGKKTQQRREQRKLL